MKEIKVSEKYLKDIIETYSTSLVGKILKRFDLFKDKETLRKLIKELTYEHGRDLETCLKAFSEGTGVDFKRPSK